VVGERHFRANPSIPAQRRWLLLVCPGLALLLVLPVAVAADGKMDTALAVTFSAGYDTNPLKVMNDGPNGLFTQLELDAGVSFRLARPLQLSLDAEGRTRNYESDLSYGDHDAGQAGLSLAITPYAANAKLVAISLGGRYGARRSTYRDRATGDIYDVEIDPPTVPPTHVPIPDRLDADVASGFLDLRWRPASRVQLSFDLLLERAEYAEDYGGSTTLLPLDYRARTFEPGLQIRVHERASLGLAVVWTELRYDEQLALDGQGQAVAGTQRRYDYTDYRLTAQVAPGRQWRLRVGLRGGGRDDLYAGYYDFDARTSFVSVDHRPADNHRLQLYTSYRNLDYANAAVVPGDPASEMRGNDVRLYLGRWDWKFKRHVRFFTEGGVQRTDSQDPVFAYDRDWLLTGIQYRR
jgi:hypothetical protein